MHTQSETHTLTISPSILPEAWSKLCFLDTRKIGTAAQTPSSSSSPSSFHAALAGVTIIVYVLLLFFVVAVVWGVLRAVRVRVCVRRWYFSVFDTVHFTKFPLTLPFTLTFSHSTRWRNGEKREYYIIIHAFYYFSLCKPFSIHGIFVRLLENFMRNRKI